MTDTVTLKPCPFCGGNDVTPVCVYHPNGYAIGCPKCGAKGPTYKASRASDLPADAITAWNTRDGGAATPMRGAASSVGADALAHLESEARRFAGFYKPNSDMANTLNILGNKIAAVALSTAQVDETERLRSVIKRAARWFDEYAVDHEVKARQARESYEQASRNDKAKRNQDRADFLRAALAPEGGAQ